MYARRLLTYAIFKVCTLSPAHQSTNLSAKAHKTRTIAIHNTQFICLRFMQSTNCLISYAHFCSIYLLFSSCNHHRTNICCHGIVKRNYDEESLSLSVSASSSPHLSNFLPFSGNRMNISTNSVLINVSFLSIFVLFIYICVCVVYVGRIRAIIKRHSQSCRTSGEASIVML